MPSQELSRVFRNWVHRVRRSGKSKTAPRRTNTVHLRLEETEQRLAPAVLPAVTVVSPAAKVDDGNTTLPDIQHSAVVAVDPLNSDRRVAIGVANNGLVGLFTTDAGTTWNNFYDTANTNTGFFGRYTDIAITPPFTPSEATQYDAVTPSITIGRDGNVYMVHVQRTSAADITGTGGGSGVVVFDSFSFTGGGLTPIVSDSIVTRWGVGGEAAFNPTVAFNNNVATFTDPTSGVTRTDTTAGKAVYVAWNTNSLAAQGSNANNFNPNVVYIAAANAADGGATFTAPIAVQDGSHSANSNKAAAGPKIGFGQQPVDVGGAPLPAPLNVIWNEVNGRKISNVLVHDVGLDQSTPAQLGPNLLPVYATKIAGENGTIGNGAADATSKATSYNVTLTFPGLNPNDQPTDLNVRLALTHANIGQLSIRLFDDLGNDVLLVDNRLKQADGAVRNNYGNGLTPGMPDGANLGIQNGITGFTVFDDSAGLAINDGNSKAPFIGSFKTEQNGFGDTINSLLAGRTAGDLEGRVWRLEITDVRGSATAPNPAQILNQFQLHFSYGLDDGLGGDVGLIPTEVDFATGKVLPKASPRSFADIYSGTADTTSKIGAGGIAIVTDTTFVAQDANGTPLNGLPSGNTYIAYTGIRNGNPDIFLFTLPEGSTTPSNFVQVNDDVVSDHFTEGNRTQFAPALAVDTTTGTLAASWYDGRFDASQLRLATFVATSIDGGNTFSPQTFLNVPKQATDAITGKLVTIEPIPSNMTVAPNAFGFGTGGQSLFFDQGKIISHWVGNQNFANSIILAAEARTAIGPRVVDNDPTNMSDQGAILDIVYLDQFGQTVTSPFQATYIYNGKDNNGPIFEQFKVVFDRPIDPTSFTAGDVTLTFTDPAGNKQNVPVGNPVAIGTNSTIFLVPLLTPRRDVGTYIYTVGPDVRDFVRIASMTVTPVAPTPPFDAAIPSTDVPLPILDFTITQSQIVLPALPVGEVIADVNVTLDISHTFTSDLVVTLISPAGTRIVLSNQNGGGGDDFTNTTFDDQAATAIGAGAPPFTGTFRPDQLLSLLRLQDTAGVWTLEIEDLFGFDEGTLNSWSLTILSGVPSSTVILGNALDQNANATAGEAPTVLDPIGDTFSIPNLVGTVVDRLPLSIPGPYFTGANVPGSPAGSQVHGQGDSLYLNSGASAIVVNFDRDIAAGSFTPASIIGMTGPYGPVAGPFTVTVLGARQFRIGFPAQIVDGPYSIEISPTITSVTGFGLDQNKNAAINVTLGNDPLSNQVKTNSYTNVPGAVAIPAGRTVSMPLNVGDAFRIFQNPAISDLRVQVQVNISHQNVPDLVGDLVAPDGTRVRLFTGVGTVGQPPRSNFNNTIFQDNGATPIQLGAAPFDIGTFIPQLPLGALVNLLATGQWQLEITNNGVLDGTINSFGLTLPYAIPGTGLAESVADRFQVAFRLFTQDPTSKTTQTQWTPVGPAIIGGPQGHESRTSAVTVDPSDPSGNTVFVGAASGGVWKTSNFLTLDAVGPAWVPLTDFGPTNSMNVGSIAVFPRNNDPNQSIVFVLTGEGNTRSGGVGVLRSMDGGRTWKVLDSTNNADAGGNILPIDSPSRDRRFVGTTGFKIIVDPNPTPTGEVIVYAAVGGAGLFRSTNTGRSWTLVKAGDATDVILAAGSIPRGGQSKNAEIIYAAFRGDGVYISTQATSALSMVLMAGGNGTPLTRTIDTTTGKDVEVIVNAPLGTPNGAKGRIALGAPVLDNTDLENSFYQGWLYAFVSTTGGATEGFYMTKDFGRNWTKVNLPMFQPGLPNDKQGFGTNNETRAGVDTFTVLPGQGGQGEYDIGITVNPLDPNIVYLAGVGTQGPTSTGSIRVDTRTVSDSQALHFYDNSDPSAAAPATRLESQTGGATVRVNENNNGTTPGLPGAGGGPNFFNLSRDPDNPFITDSTILVNNTQAFVNDGADVKWRTFFNPLGGTADIHQILSFIDPVTRKARLIYLGDQSIGSGIDIGDGTDTFVGSVGFTRMPFANRTGNLQITQFYAGAAQPSQLAGDIAAAFFYGGSQDNGSPRSAGNVLQTGNIQWVGPAGDASGVATDQTGSGTAYVYQWPCCGPFFATDFFRVDFPVSDNAFGVGRTTGLLQAGDDPGADKGQWPLITQAVGYMAINPIDKNGALISSAAGRVFRSTTLADPSVGANWFPVGEPTSIAGQLEGSISKALAFGAPDPANPGQVNNFLYAGNNFGNIFVTNTGGAPWTNISAGLHPGSMFGSPVQDIEANPRRGSRDAFAVTTGGVFYNPDSLAPGSTWQNITGNLFTLEKMIFGDPTETTRTLQSLSSLAVDWRYAIPDDPGNPSGPTHPVLYVAGTGGVFRSRDKGQTWHYFPEVNEDGAAVDGGYLPNVEITDLDLSLGNIDPATGLPNQGQGGLNLLMATTYGRGQFAIRLNTTIDNDFNVQFESGPIVARLANPNNLGGPSNQLRVVFDQSVDPVTFTAADVILLDTNGNKVNVTNVQLAPPPLPPGSPQPFNEYIITFDPQATPGFYSLTVGQTISDFAGNLMNQNQNKLNGEAEDAFRRLVFLNGSKNSIIVDGLPLTVVAGTTATFTVSVENQQGFPDATFLGTVGFTSSDPNASVPANYTFVAGDAGKHTFTVTFRTAGPQTVSVASVLAGVANPGSDNTVVINAPASQLFVAGHPSPVTAGTDNAFTVTAKDQFGNVALDYLGLISIGSTDTKALLTTTYQFTAADKGTVTFTAQLRTAGLQDITAMDTVNVALVGAQTGILVNPAAASKLAVVNLPNPFNAGDFKNFAVRSLDPFGNVAPDYKGTVTFTSSDPFAALPADYQFTAGDNGSKTFQVQLRIAGTQTVTASDTLNAVTPGIGTTLVTPAAVTGFTVVGYPSPVLAGSDNMFTVTAIAPGGGTAVGYLGTVNFSSSDQQAGLPASYTFTVADNGSKTFSAQLKTAGTQSITATDSSNSSVTGKQSGIVVLPDVAKTLTIAGFPSPTTAGVVGNVTVTARDQFDNVATGYTGTIRFTSSDLQSGLPADFTFTGAQAGVMSFAVNLKTAGTQSITATDLVTPSIAGSQTGIVVNAAAASKFILSGHPSPVNAGASSNFTVTAQDPFGNVDVNYAGKVNFGSTDAQASLPAAYTFTATDQGVRIFSDTLRTAGLQSVTATDTANASIVGTASNINVLPGAAVGISITGYPSPTTAGVPQSFLVAARDQFNNIAPSYTGTVRFTGSDKNAALPPNFTFTAGDAGQHTFVGTLKTAGTHSLTVTDLAKAAFTSTQSGIVVNPAAGSVLILTSIPPSVVAGANNTVLATVRDPFGNIATTYSGTLSFSSSDPQAGLPANYTFTSTDKGQKTFVVSLKTAGTQNVNVNDTADNTIGTSQSGIQVTAAAASRFEVAGLPATVIAGVSAGFTVTARDAFGNLATNYTGIVTFASSDNRATLPTNTAFAPADQGVRTFSAKFGIPNVTSSVTATDLQFPAITGTASTAVQPNFDKGTTLVGNQQFAIGTEAANALPVRYYDSNGNFVFESFPFQSDAVNGGGRVATADFNGDGRAELIAGSSPGTASLVTVIDGFTEKLVFEYRPFEASFLGGVYITGGDLTGDGVPELVITPDEGGGPRVTVLDGKSFTVIADFFGIDDPNFRGGARSAVGDLNGDGFGDLLVAAGFGGGPRVAGYDGQTFATTGKLVKIFNDFFAFEESLRNGVFIAAGDLDGDGKAEMIVGGGPGGGPRVTAFDGAGLLANQQNVVANFFGGDPNNRGGVRLAVKDLDGDDRADLITGAGTGAGSRLTAYYGKNLIGNAAPPVGFEFDAYSGFQGGIFVG